MAHVYNMVGGSGGAKLTGVAVTTDPDQVRYKPGASFNPDGMVVTAAYSNGATAAATGYRYSPSGALTEDDTLITITYTEGGVTVTATLEITVGNAIYGVSWDGTSTTAWTRTDASADFVDPVPYVAGAESYGSPFDELQPWAGMVVEERDGGTMVAIPKFWYKLTQGESGGLTIQIADGEEDGFSVSPAHMDRGDGKGERDVVYIGRYHCCADNGKSVTGAFPAASMTRAKAREDISALGDNIWQMDFALWFTLWLLYLVEFADWDSQGKIGSGCGNGSNAEAMGSTDSMPYHTGTMQSDRATYGVGIQYRNIEDLWANVADWCDGCYNDSNGMNIILNPSAFSDSEGGTSIGIIENYGPPTAFAVSSAGGFALLYPIEFGDDWNFATYSCDYWRSDSNCPVVIVGGPFDGQYPSCGLFFVSCDEPSDSWSSIGCRLQELP